MKRSLALIVIALLFVQASHAARPPIDPDKKKLVDQLVALTVTEQGLSMPEFYARYFTDKQAERVEQRARKVDPKVLVAYQEIAEKFFSQHADRLNDRLYYVYDKYYDEDELKALLQFYRTDVGRKSLEIHTDFRARIHMETEHWGTSLEQQLNREAAKQLEEKGLLPAKRVGSAD